MAKADVLTTVTNLSNGLADQTIISQYYDDIVRDLGRSMWLTNFGTQSLSSDTSLVSLADSVIMPFIQIFNGNQLGEVDIRQANWLTGTAWKTTYGTPLDVCYEAESRKTFRLVPGTSAGGSMLTIWTEYRANVPNYLQWPIALLIFELEFTRQSDHQDLKLAKAAGDLGRLMLLMVA